jgi:thiamine biosynthesis lipoprotein
MKETRKLMGMTVTVEIVDDNATIEAIENIFIYFKYIDEKFSTYKETSEISAINRGEIKEKNYSEDMKEVFALSEKTKEETKGYFDIKKPDGKYDPSGMVKGWAIRNAGLQLERAGFKNFYVDVGGDMQVHGLNAEGKVWSVGIKNPFNQDEIVKVVYLSDKGMATSGTYIREQHIYNPHKEGTLNEVFSLSVIGPNIYEADRFATAGFAMGREGIYFIESIPGLEGYMIDKDGLATETTGFEKYTKQK